MLEGVPMRVLLQNRESLLYLQQPDQWTADVKQATNFEHIQTAREFARAAKLPNLDVVMFLGDDRHYSLRVPASP
jgi:hypothetical protein